MTHALRQSRHLSRRQIGLSIKAAQQPAADAAPAAAPVPANPAPAAKPAPPGPPEGGVDDLPELEGKTEDELLARLGEPSSRRTFEMSECCSEF